MKKLFIVLLLLCLPGLALSEDSERFILMASTIGPVDAGIVPLLEERFEQESGITVRHVAAVTGEALKMAEGGTFDLVLVHAKSLEEQFIANGYGTERIPLMYNDFVILGPPADPAGVKGSATAAEALKKIAAAEARFVSRGDNSGTHVAEQELWKKAGVRPECPWYIAYERGSEGNAATLKYADQIMAYTFMDRATYLSMKKKIELVVLEEKDEALLNYISLIPVNPAKFPRVNARDTQTFVSWLTAPEQGQRLIADFGKDKFGAPLFFPNSVQWRGAHGR